MRLNETLAQGTRIFVDRYFTTIRLLELSLAKRIAVTGTIMKSRVPACSFNAQKCNEKDIEGLSEQT